MYYNTTKTTGQELKKLAKKTKKQNDLIFKLFKLNRKLALSPFEVQAILIRLGLTNAPITSIIRAMTNLTQDGLLSKTNTKRLGPYGRDSYCWKLK